MAEKATSKHHPFFVSRKSGPEVIAHRGGAGEWPGETIYAFEEAVKCGVDILEMDIRYTSDDVPILMHNSNVMGTTGVDQHVNEFTSDEIQHLDAAHWWRQAGKGFPEGAKLRVPKLEDVLRDFRDRRLNIEIKPFNLPIRLIRALGRLLRDYEMSEKVLIASGSHMNLFFLRREFPEIATSASFPEMAGFRAFKGIGYQPHCETLQISSKAGPLHFITRAYVEKAHSLNLQVHGWTVNEPEEMGRLISLGIDGIITNYPTILLELLGRTRSPTTHSNTGS